MQRALSGAGTPRCVGDAAAQQTGVRLCNNVVNYEPSVITRVVYDMLNALAFINCKQSNVVCKSVGVVLLVGAGDDCVCFKVVASYVPPLYSKKMG